MAKILRIIGGKTFFYQNRPASRTRIDSVSFFSQLMNEHCADI